jgi:hypothetical protein
LIAQENLMIYLLSFGIISVKTKNVANNMIKKFSVPCDFNGQKSPFTIYIGEPEANHHPLQFQANWLSKERGGSIPPEVMDSVAKLKALADKNGVSFEDLCVYALGTAQEEAAMAADQEEDENFIDDSFEEDDEAEEDEQSDE